MPIYPFRCLKCGHKQDELLPIKDMNKPEPCPKCGSRKRQRDYSDNNHERIMTISLVE